MLGGAGFLPSTQVRCCIGRFGGSIRTETNRRCDWMSRGYRQVTETEIVLVIDCFCCCICFGKLTKIPCKSLATIFLVRLVCQFHHSFLVEVYHAKGSPPFLKMVATTSTKYLASTIEVQHRSIIGNKHPRDSIYGVFTYICLNLGKYTI